MGRRQLLIGSVSTAASGGVLMRDPVALPAGTATIIGHIPYGAPDWVYVPSRSRPASTGSAWSTATTGPPPRPGRTATRSTLASSTSTASSSATPAASAARPASGASSPAPTCAGGLAVAAHPLATCVACGWKFGYAGLDAVEVWNGPWTLDDEAVLAG
jgi:hypothetical protein